MHFESQSFGKDTQNFVTVLRRKLSVDVGERFELLPQFATLLFLVFYSHIYIYIEYVVYQL